MNVMNASPTPPDLLQKLVDLEHQACSLGFIWTSGQQVLDWAQSELDEVRAAYATTLVSPSPSATAHMMEEVGDLIQVMLSLCVQQNFDVHELLQKNHNKFSARLQALDILLQKRKTENNPPQSWEDFLALWQLAKTRVAV